MSAGPSGGGPASWTTDSSGAAPTRSEPMGQLGRYRLCAELASGGMGTVYLARADGPHGFEKLVALKSIHPHLAKDRRFVEMFLDEARIAARLSHPNVCAVIDFGEAGGTYYLTMPFLLGESLHVVQRALRRSKDAELRAASPFVIARLLADACEGLHAAHELRDERGEPLAVVHRDVSPQNLFVGFEGTMSVLDFGVASARHRLHSTATGEVKGKFSYAAPEQLESRPIDRRADVWSLGVVLWEHAVQRRLFARDDAGATIRAVLESPIPPLRELWPEAPLGLEEIVFRALARDPARRYATAREMGRDLLGFLSEEGQGIGPPHVADWLERLMPDARAEKAKLIE
ncbi:MAG: serine/threonine protein kinase, partial [Myxococcota bacterium]|nr:serine/threonine protein kinase [Myxococcota bacterium]